MLALALALAAQGASADSPALNPYLAQSYNNQSHLNDGATNSVDFAVQRGHYALTPQSAEVIPNESFSGPLVMDKVGGKDVYWWWSGFGLRKLVDEQGKLVEVAHTQAPVTLPNYQTVTPQQRREQALAVQKFLDAGDEKGLLTYLKAQPNRLISMAEDQVAAGALYTLLGRDDTFYSGSGRRFFRIAQKDPQDPKSTMTQMHTVIFPESLFDNEKVARGTRFKGDMIFGMGMSYNGYVVANTLGGKVITLNRDTLEIIDTFSVAGDQELFLNSFATGPEANNGAVYVASNSNMYRLVVDKDGKIHSDEASGAWKAPYDRGVMMGAPKIADGTGSTPALMGFGANDDKLVVITDGAKKMRLVAFWRDQIPQGWKQRPGTLSPRIADQHVVDMGEGIETVQSEQGVATSGNYAFVVNNIPNKQVTPLDHSLAFANLTNGATRPGPRGAAAFQWQQDSHSWQQKWSRDDVSSVSVVPLISGPSHMAIIDGYFANKWNDRYTIGMDLDTGKSVLTIRKGSDPSYNGFYAVVKVDTKGRIMHGNAFGLARLDTDKMEKVEAPDAALNTAANR
ncbi:hypothetical protein E1573_08505 [Pseudomonas sp. H9]|nr:hypothetical protein E1573_08505 [Pseudomonas sp. H9]